MVRHCFCPRGRFIWFCLLATTVSTATLITSNQTSLALTASYGQPYHGRLVNGIPFPREFTGYQLREEERTYTTPEVIGAVLDAIDAVQKQFPGACDLYMGDFSVQNGGSASRHRSHQNGRDVDLGMYAKGNRTLDTFIPMNEDNLDAAKTWCFIEALLRSQRVQYIFLDRRIQKILYDYALGQGVDPNYLDRLFGNARGSIIQHVVNHHDHMHVRFFTPWSTLGAHVTDMDDGKRSVIEMAQQAYLPKKVQYYAKGNEHNLETLAQSFGVSKKELCRWNQLRGNELLAPGTCLVFYKRAFEVEPVYLAQSLQPNYTPAPPAPSIQLASLEPPKMIPARAALSDMPSQTRDSGYREKKSEPPAPLPTYSAKSGDTLEKVAARNHMDVQALCDLNGMRKNSRLRAGQTIKLASVKPVALDTSPDTQSASNSASSARLMRSLPVPASKAQSPPALTTYTVEHGDTLPKIAKQKGLDVDTLCYMNGMKKNCALRPGQRLLLAKVESSKVAPKTVVSTSSKSFTRPDSGKAVTGKSKPTAAEAKSSSSPKRSASAAIATKPGASTSSKTQAKVEKQDSSVKIARTSSAKQGTEALAKSASSPKPTPAPIAKQSESKQKQGELKKKNEPVSQKGPVKAQSESNSKISAKAGKV